MRVGGCWLGAAGVGDCWLGAVGLGDCWHGTVQVRGGGLLAWGSEAEGCLLAQNPQSPQTHSSARA